MRRSLLAAGLGAIFFAGCKEVPPTINFNATNYVDTAYMTGAPVTNPHNVLAEEFTGESCSNCPQGHAILDASSAANPGRVNVISLYEIGFGVLIPPGGASYDFRDSAALEIGNSAIYNGVTNFPIGGIDRVPYTGTSGNLIGDGNWAGAINNRLGITDSLNMTVASTYGSSVGGAIATMTVTLTYTQAVSTQQNISVAVVEDSIIDFQEQTFGIIDSSYVFNDVFVGMVSAVPYGDPVLPSMTTKSAGQVLQRVYTYKLPISFSKGLVNATHCRVIAFVNAPGTGINGSQVYQSVQAPLMGP